MPYKCSVKFCRSNYDSTNEKVSVFQFPTDPEMRDLWLKNIILNNSKLTSSSRVCIKHFDANDIDNSNTRRSMLKPKVVPHSSVEIMQDSPPSQEKNKSETQEMFEEYVENSPPAEEMNENTIGSFSQFLERLEEMQEGITDNWNIYTQDDGGVCLYRLASIDDEFSDVIITFKILINKNLQVKIYNYDNEASSEELLWLLKDSQLKHWSEFDSLINTYHNEPDITLKKQPIKSLKKAYEALEEINWDELQERIDALKFEIASLYQSTELMRHLEEDDFYAEPKEIEANNLMDSFEEFLDDDDDLIEKDLDDSSIKVECSEESQQDSVNDAMEAETLESTEMEDVIEYESLYKCENCHITLLSDAGYRSHRKTCNTPTFVQMRVEKPSKPTPVPKKELHVCDYCGKSYRTSKALKDHMKLHDSTLRQKCPLCDVVIFTGILKRHIDAVHKQLKPHLW